MKKKVLSKFLIVLGLSLLMVVLVGCASTSVDDGSPNPSEYTDEPQEKTSEGYYVYYTEGIWFKKDRLNLTTVTLDFMYVVNMQENLTIVVNEEYSGTVLIAKHWQNDTSYVIDDAELVVRTQDEKDIWEEAILEYLEEWERSEQLRLAPRDVLPPGFVTPEAKAFLGILFDPNYSAAIEFDDKVIFGVRIKEVIEDTLANRAGLKEGDLIIAVDGEEFTSWSQFNKLLPRRNPEDKISLTVVRDGEEMLVTIFLALPPKK